MESIKNKLKEKLEKEFSASNLQEIIEYCKENIQSMDLNNDTDFYLCNVVNSYLLKNKICQLDKEEAKFLTISLAKLGIKLFNIKEENLNIDVMLTEEYEKLRGEKGIAVSIRNDNNSHSIIYSEKVCDELISDEPNDFLRGLQTIFHEIVHVFQDEKMQRNYQKLNSLQAKNSYIMALEDIVRKISPEFYKKNYANLLIENDAEKNGLICAMHILGTYNRNAYNFFDKEVIEERINRYNIRTIENEKEIFGIESEKGKTLMLMEFVARETFKRKPELLKEYPILEVAYHKDGTPKSILELLEDRKFRLEQNERLENDSIDNANELLFTIVNNRDMSAFEKMQEIESLEQYIVSKNIKDEFVYELLHNRLQRCGLKEELIEERIKGIRNDVAEKYKEFEKNNLIESLKNYTCTDEEYKENVKKSEERSKNKISLIEVEKNEIEN